MKCFFDYLKDIIISFDLIYIEESNMILYEKFRMIDTLDT